MNKPRFELIRFTTNSIIQGEVEAVVILNKKLKKRQSIVSIRQDWNSSRNKNEWFVIVENQ